MYLGGRFGYFLFFSARGGGRGSPGRRERGGSIFIENPRRGGLQEGRGQGAGRVSAANLGIGGGGGLNIFFRGRSVHQGMLVLKGIFGGSL